MHRHAVESRRAPRRLDLRPGGGSPGAADRPDPAFAKKESATSASRRRQRVARLPVGAAAPRQGIKTSPKYQTESTAETAALAPVTRASADFEHHLLGGRDLHRRGHSRRLLALPGD